MHECLMKCICCICVEEFHLAHNQKQCLTVNWTLNDRPGPVIITTSQAETLQASSEWEGKCLNKHLFTFFKQIFPSSKVNLLWRTCTAKKYKAFNVPSTDLNRNTGNSAEAVLRAKTGWFLWQRQTQTSIMLQTVSPKAKDNLPQQVSIMGYF